MADLKKAFAKTVGNEGGYDAHSNDRGNWTSGIIGVGVLAGTKYGITCWEVGEYLKKGYVYMHDKATNSEVKCVNVTPNEVKNLSLDSAYDIYRRKYWNVMRGDEINDQDYANTIFDFGVNVGISMGIKKWQAILGLTQTGKMDNITLEKTNSII